MGADRPVPRRQRPGAPVQLVALGAGQLEGEGADDLVRGALRASLLQTQDDPGRERELWDAVERFTVAHAA
nr:hypothetical protein [Streptomyces sabulosicollis]